MKPALFFAFALLSATAVWYGYGGNVSEFFLLLTLEFVLVAWPGKVLLARLFPTSTLLEQYVFGNVLGSIAIGALLKFLGLILPVALIPLVLAVVTRYFAWGSRNGPKSSISLIWPTWILFSIHLLFLSLFLYGQYYFSNSTLHFHYFPAVDLTYFLTVLTSLSHFGEFRDLAQLGTHFNYTDLGYQFYALVHRLTDIEAFDLLILFAPFKEYLLVALCMFAICLRVSSRAVALLVATGVYLIASRNMIEITVLSTNPAFRMGFAIFLLGLWAWHYQRGPMRHILVAVSLVALIFVKPAIWLVVAPSFAIIAFFDGIKRESAGEVIATLSVVVVSALVFFLEFGPGRSGLDEDHYTLIFGRGLEPTIKFLADRFGFADVRTEVIKPLEQIGLNSVFLGVLVFFPFLIQQIRHSAGLLLLIFGWTNGRARSTYALHLTVIATLCFLYLGFIGFEYSGFLHGYMIPLATFVSLLGFAALWQTKLYQTRRSRVAAISIVVFFAVYGVVHALYGFYHQRAVMPSFEISTALIKEYRAIRELTDTSAVIAVDNSDLFFPGDERSYLASAFIERRILSEGLYYGSLLMGYPENNRHHLRTSAADTIRARRAVQDSIFRSSDPRTILLSASKYEVTHVLRRKKYQTFAADGGDILFRGRELELIKL